MNLFDRLMGQKPAEAQPVAPTEAPPAAEAAPAPVVPKNTTVPSATNVPPASPLADYDKMWETAPNEGNKAPSFNLNREAVTNMSNQINFSDNITKEQLASIANGGEEAIESMMAVLNATAKNAFVNTTETTGHLINKALASNNKFLESSIPTHIKQATVSSNLAKSNSGFKDPAVAPILKMMETQLLAQYPNASADELTAQAETYLTGLASIINPAEKAPEATKQQASEDFSNYLN